MSPFSSPSDTWNNRLLIRFGSFGGFGTLAAFVVGIAGGLLIQDEEPAEFLILATPLFASLMLTPTAALSNVVTEVEGEETHLVRLQAQGTEQLVGYAPALATHMRAQAANLTRFERDTGDLAHFEV